MYTHHQLPGGCLAEGAQHVLDGQRLCGEYQFDMSVREKMLILEKNPN